MLHLIQRQLKELLASLFKSIFYPYLLPVTNYSNQLQTISENIHPLTGCGSTHIGLSREMIHEGPTFSCLVLIIYFPTNSRLICVGRAERERERQRERERETTFIHYIVNLSILQSTLTSIHLHLSAQVVSFWDAHRPFSCTMAYNDSQRTLLVTERLL